MSNEPGNHRTFAGKFSEADLHRMMKEVRLLNAALSPEPDDKIAGYVRHARDLEKSHGHNAHMKPGMLIT